MSNSSRMRTLYVFSRHFVCKVWDLSGLVCVACNRHVLTRGLLAVAPRLQSRASNGGGYGESEASLEGFISILSCSNHL